MSHPFEPSDAAERRPDDLPAADESVGVPEAAGADAVGEQTERPALPPRRLFLVLALASSILIVDQITKVIAVASLTPGRSPRILGGLVYLSLFRNPGAAWSLGTGLTWVLAVVACVVVVVIIRMASKLRSGWWATCLGLILGGALGNLMDRFFRSPGFLRGHVVDFVSVFGPNAEYFPVFNVADSGITIGAILLVITAARGIELDGSRARSRAGRRGRSGSSTSNESESSDLGSDGPGHG